VLRQQRTFVRSPSKTKSIAGSATHNCHMPTVWRQFGPAGSFPPAYGVCEQRRPLVVTLNIGEVGATLGTRWTQPLAIASAPAAHLSPPSVADRQNSRERFPGTGYRSLACTANCAAWSTDTTRCWSRNRSVASSAAGTERWSVASTPAWDTSLRVGAFANSGALSWSSTNTVACVCHSRAPHAAFCALAPFSCATVHSPGIERSPCPSRLPNMTSIGCSK
jgi:hypothetical protein